MTIYNGAVSPSAGLFDSATGVAVPLAQEEYRRKSLPRADLEDKENGDKKVNTNQNEQKQKREQQPLCMGFDTAHGTLPPSAFISWKINPLRLFIGCT